MEVLLGALRHQPSSVVVWLDPVLVPAAEMLPNMRSNYNYLARSLTSKTIRAQTSGFTQFIDEGRPLDQPSPIYQLPCGAGTRPAPGLQCVPARWSFHQQKSRLHGFALPLPRF